MIVLLTCATVLAALGWLTAWMTADQVAGLVAERDAADERTREARADARNWESAAWVHQCDAETESRRANDAEFATFLALNELDRVDPRPNLGAVGPVALAVTS